MTKQQKKFIKKLEIALATFVYDGKKELAAMWSPILEALWEGNSVIAVFMAEERPEIPEALVHQMSNVFGVRRLG